MARLTRLCIPGWPHLVVQRGHDRGLVFVDDLDRALFRDLLQEAALQHGVQLHAYGLLEHEVRLLAKPMAADGLSKLIQAIGRGYVIRFNRRHGRRGALWEGRFRATVVEPEQHLLDCMLFVEGAADGGPSGQQENAWCSAPHHLGAKVDPLVTEPAQYWALGNTPFDREAAYRHLYEQALTTKKIEEIRGALSAGWPLGTPAFRHALEDQTERRLTPLPRGRPRKLA
ncbi:transposase [Piscinibacter gummiphilus]|uniref:Transposase n=1 Tax=Piscinibacter gummiphilus TaxID=946333 RepID=A0ABZ0D232_9BURK|nr:transposase [Piscinibacter gummiphilus]WOB09297.1 transposase [Piscinibacter gummiphilus]